MHRIQKLIAHAGVCSRRKAEELIEQGRVMVNGKKARLGESASEDDEIRVDGVRLQQEKKTYLMLHKPAGYITTSSDPWGRHSVLSLLHEPKRVFPVGRLDKDTTGLLLLTNDGDFANRVTHPRYEVKKTYEATLDKKISDGDLQKIRDGVVLEKKKVKAQARKLSGRIVEITIHTGMNKEVKRIFKSLGYWVRKLHRTKINDLKLDVKPGKHRHLVASEVQKLLDTKQRVVRRRSRDPGQR